MIDVNLPQEYIVIIVSVTHASKYPGGNRMYAIIECVFIFVRI